MTKEELVEKNSKLKDKIIELQEEIIILRNKLYREQSVPTIPDLGISGYNPFI